MGFLSEEQKATALERANDGGDGAGGGQRPAEAQAPEVIDQGGAETQEQGAGAEEAQAKAPDNRMVTLKDGRQVEIDGAEADRLMQLGLEAGDEDTIKAVRGLEQFVGEDPRRGDALKAFIDNPEATAVLLEQFGGKGGTEDGAESPQDKELRELRAENARLQNQGKPGGKSQVDVIADAAAKYPALKGLPKNTLAMAVKGHMADGQSLTSALVTLATEQTGSEVLDGDGKRSTMRNADRLTGIGAGGAAPSATPGQPAKDGNALRNGSARAAAARRLAGR
jgi:hypothetical protein